jgi:predicted O-methyltransferase YrrM
MPSDPLTCTLLRSLAASKPGGQFLELGSGTGLSTAWLLDGMDARAKLTTVDNDASLLTILNRHLGHDARLKVVCADGDEFLRQTHKASSTTTSLPIPGQANTACLMKPWRW